MLTTFLVTHPWLTTVGFVALVVLGPPLGWLLAPHRRAAAVLAAVACVPVLLLTLVPTSRRAYATCAVEWSLPTPGRVELVANVLLLAPAVLLLAVALGRPVVALVVGSAASAAIEGLQALLPALGRSCSTNDWLSNTLGALLGALLAAFALWAARGGGRVEGPPARLT